MNFGIPSEARPLVDDPTVPSSLAQRGIPETPPVAIRTADGGLIGALAPADSRPGLDLDPVRARERQVLIDSIPDDEILTPDGRAHRAAIENTAGVEHLRGVFEKIFAATVGLLPAPGETFDPVELAARLGEIVPDADPDAAELCLVFVLQKLSEAGHLMILDREKISGPAQFLHLPSRPVGPETRVNFTGEFALSWMVGDTGR